MNITLCLKPKSKLELPNQLFVMYAEEKVKPQVILNGVMRKRKNYN